VSVLHFACTLGFLLWARLVNRCCLLKQRVIYSTVVVFWSKLASRPGPSATRILWPGPSYQLLTVRLAPSSTEIINNFHPEFANLKGFYSNLQNICSTQWRCWHVSRLSTCYWMVRSTVVSRAQQRPRLTPMLAFFWIYFRPFGDVCSVGGDVPVDYKGVCGNFVNLKMMCRLSLSEMLIEVGAFSGFTSTYAHALQRER
jgi:hypothetical protein